MSKMNSDDAIIMTALKFVCGESKHVCRLCFAITDKKEVSIEDSVRVQTHSSNDTVTFITMFHELGVSMEPPLPCVICVSCATLVINSYMFQKLCIYSNNKWTEIVDRISDNLAKSDSIGDNIQSIYLMINKMDNLMFTSRRRKSRGSKRMALIKVKEVMRNKQKYLKSKDMVTKNICKECDERFDSRPLLLQHIKIHTKSNNPCEKCPKVFSTPQQLEVHNERIHCPKRLKCTKCPKMFSTERVLRVHIRYNHIKATCKLCSKKLSCLRALRTHMDKHAVDRCPNCNKIYTNRHTYKSHIKICGHDDKQPNFFCDICSKGYVRKNGLRTHLKIEHGFGDVLVCDWCDKKFDAVSRLKGHIVKHTKERNFSCNECGGKFVTRASLIYHSRLHTGERPFPCDLCDESFLSSSRRMEHKRNKHFEPKHECHICHVKFTTSNHLRKHVQRHSNPQSKLYVPDDDYDSAEVTYITY